MRDESAEAAKERRDRKVISSRDQQQMNRLVASLLFNRGTMDTNTSVGDRVLRVAAGALLLAIVFFGPTTPWGIVGIVPLLTGLTGSCPFYRAFGVSTQRPSSH